MPTPYAYIAGPLFDRAQRWYNTQLSNVVSGAGFETYLPQDASGEVDLAVADNRAAVFLDNVKALRGAAFVVANLNGPVVDEGTAWECGFAWALGKKVLGVREARGGPPANLMLDRSAVVLPDTAALRELLARPFSF
ncbi:MAG: nucleoside 2-deoxyribosyltransferase [Candidatus Methylomirabilis sp.]|nr:nucleoside 2-deoxyribosyltransferase [Deltaproteobacteria bacterium]